MINEKQFLLPLFLKFLLLMLSGSLSPTFAASIIVLPTSINIDKGQSFSIDFSVKDITDLYAFQFDIEFDPNLVSATSVAEGAFLPSGGSTFFVSGSIDNVLGTIVFNANTLLSAVLGVTGNGILETITFTAIATGRSDITILNLSLLDSGLNGIATTVANGSVTVGQSSVPEPSTPILLFGAFFIARRYRLKTQVSRLILLRKEDQKVHLILK